MSTILESALGKLQWGSTQRDWSVDLNGPECAALLEDRAAGGRALTYLAVPYSHPDREMRELRFVAANRAAGLLLKRGYVVFSPISHTHPIAEHCELPGDWHFWQDFDRAYLAAAQQLVVLCIDGWDESVGVQAEIAIAREMEIPIAFMRPDGEIFCDLVAAVDRQTDGGVVHG